MAQFARFAALSALLFFFSAAAAFVPAPVAAKGTPPEIVPLIQVDQLQTLIASKQPFVLLDVRQPEEFAQGHIDGAILIPLDTMEARYAELSKKKEIVVYCRSGHRSAQAVSILKAHGFKKVFSLAGGFNAWTAAHRLKL